MASTTYYVALAFTRSEDGDIVACEPKEARSSNQAIRMADALAATEGHCGAIAFSRTGDPALGDFADAVILKTVGEVDSGLLAGSGRDAAEGASAAAGRQVRQFGGGAVVSRPTRRPRRGFVRASLCATQFRRMLLGKDYAFGLLTV